MSKILLKLLTLLLVLVLCFGIAACQNVPDDSTDDENKDDENKDDENKDDDDGIDWDNLDLDGLALIYNGKARFQVVYASQAGSECIRLANDFVDELRELGVDVDDAVSDKDAEDVKDCEIIIGTGVRHRGDDAVLNDKHLGKDGYAIKVVGNKIIIGGGNAGMTRTAFDRYKRLELKITSSTKEIVELAVDPKYSYEKLTTYDIDSVTIGGNDLRDYVLIEDLTKIPDGVELETIASVQQIIYDETGIWLEYGLLDDADSYEHKVVVRYVHDKAAVLSDGFHAYVDENGDLIIECSYWNAFDAAFKEFFDEYLVGEKGNVSIEATLNYSKNVSVVYYKDFGADGNDTKDDFDAIWAAHEYANLCGQKVMGDIGADITYYVGPKLGYSKKEKEEQKINNWFGIPIKTDVDFNGATFIVDDTGSDAYATRNNGVFHLVRDYEPVSFGEKAIKEAFGEDLTIRVGDTKFEWLAPYIEEKSFVYVQNNHHRDFVRWGSNQGLGDWRREVYIVEPDGTLAADTQVVFDFIPVQETSVDDTTGESTVVNRPGPSQIIIYRVDDAPVTVENGLFINKCCTTVAETEHINKFHEYARGFYFERSNVTFKNIEHQMKDEPAFKKCTCPAEKCTCAYGYNIHDKAKLKRIDTNAYGGRRDESYPYYAFILTERTYNLLVEDVQLTGHTTYYEDKPAVTSTGGNIPAPVAMGTYDMVLERSINVTFRGVTQRQEQYGMTTVDTLGDNRFWGIMSSNWTRNMVFEDCEINRFDAHRSMWGAVIKDTTIGHTINIVGGGDLLLENVTKLAGASGFIQVRQDYGGTYSGNITIRNCAHKAWQSYNSMSGGSLNKTKYEESVYLISVGYYVDSYGYFDWDFGYDSYMPPEVTVEGGFTTNAKNVYVFNDIPDEAFYKEIVGVSPVSYAQHPLIKTQKITFVNMSVIPTCANSAACQELSNIPVTTKTAGKSGDE